MKFRYLKIGVRLKHYLKKLKYCFRFLKRDLEIPKTTTALNFVSNFSNEICITITPLKCLRPSYTAYIKHFYIKSSRKITMLIIDMCGRLLLGSSVFWSGKIAAIISRPHCWTNAYCLRSLFA